jgi:hypothetical protein
LIGDKDCKKADRPKVDIGNATYWYQSECNFDLDCGPAKWDLK